MSALACPIARTLANELLVLIQSLTILTISLVIIWVKAFNPKGKENDEGFIYSSQIRFSLV
jgi:hypothetical protein